MNRSRGTVIALVAALAMLALPGRAMAVTYTPTTTGDGTNGACTPALCTLRDAVVAANAGPGNDVSIQAGTYTLNLGQLLITQPMTVAGSGARSTAIDAQGTSRVMEIGAGGINVNVRDLTITGGLAGPTAPSAHDEGGGILTQGNLNLQRAAIVGNRANLAGGGISAPLKADGPNGNVVTTIADSLIANNRVSGGGGVGFGGGMSLFGDSTITNSTVTGNVVTNPGGNEGAGISGASNFWAGPGGTLTLINTTVSGNTIDGPGAGFGGGVSGVNFNIAPGFLTPPILNNLIARNTIIAGNQVNGARQDCSQVKTDVSVGNLSSDATCGFTDTSSKQNADPQLKSLADNGGPTNTMAIGDGSPALNAGTNDGCPGADQRGITRPQAEICDIGAFEAIGPDLSVAQRVKGKKRKKGNSATEAGVVKRKRVTFIVTVSNQGEQSAPGARLIVKVSKATAKLRVKGCKSAGKGKKGKRKKGGRKKLACSLRSLGPGETDRIRVRVRPKAKTKGRIVSKVRVVGAGDPDKSNNLVRTKVRVKRKPRR